MVLITLNRISPKPKEKISSIFISKKLFLERLGVVGTITSPMAVILPRRLFLIWDPGTCIITPCSAGAIVIFFASFRSAFLMVTVSPIDVFAFLRIYPSMRMISRNPESEGYGLIAIQPVFLLPSISTTSPSRIPISDIIAVSKRTIPIPISDCALLGISPTLRCTSFFMISPWINYSSNYYLFCFQDIYKPKQT